MVEKGTLIRRSEHGPRLTDPNDGSYGGARGWARVVGCHGGGGLRNYIYRALILGYGVRNVGIDGSVGSLGGIAGGVPCAGPALVTLYVLYL